MFTLIIFLVIGLIIAYLAISNSMLVTLNFGPYVFPGIPLFYIIVGSLLIGLGLSYFVALIRSISTGFTMRKKDKKIKETRSEIVDLTKRIHQLELENEKLKNKSTIVEPQDKNAL